MQNGALNLSNPNEVYTVGIPVTVAMYSFSYWKANGQTWADTFADQDSIRNLLIAYSPMVNKSPIGISLNADNELPNFSEELIFNQQNITQPLYFKRFKLGGGQLIAADIGGGISGAIDGVLLGPGGRPCWWNTWSSDGFDN